MFFRDVFRKVNNLTAVQVREFIARRNPESYVLLDVRTLEEYTRRHLGGALLIPVDELGERLDEVARDKPVVVY